MSMHHNPNSTAARVLAALQPHNLKERGNGKYRCNSPLRPGSNSGAFDLRIQDDEHGTFFDHVTEEAGSLYDLAARLSITPALHLASPRPAHDNTTQNTTKRAYSGLEDYAAAHHATADTFARAGWRETKYRGRPALAFATKNGTRWRFLDGQRPPYLNERGYQSCWYGLERAVALGHETGQPLVLCNGEASTVTAQAHGLAACAITNGEKAALPAPLLDELRAVYPDGAILVALDCDAPGQRKAPGLARQLSTAGYAARAVDLEGGIEGYDLADFIGRHGAQSATALAACPPLPEAPAEPAPDAVPPPPPPAACPPLPAEAIAVYEHLDEERVAWLHEYVRWASAAAPRTPRAFHEAAALFAASTAVARRLRWRDIYPNLFFLFLAPSTLYSKTTGLNLLSGLLREADLAHLLLPQHLTPEALVDELSLTVPPAVLQADDLTRARWLRERAFAAQRGWALDEAFRLFDSLKRDYTRGLLPMILELYNCKDEMTAQTRGRWRTTIQNSYLAFFGATTPASMHDHLNTPRYWADGLWARFILLLPDSDPVYQFFPDRGTVYPAGIIRGLQGLADLFPTPSAELLDDEGADGTTRKIVHITGAGEPHEARLAPGVREAWQCYDKTIWDFQDAGRVEPELHPNYGRIATNVLKVALLLAALDAERLPITVELAHFAHAQEIAERWRYALHDLRATNATTGGERDMDKLLGLLDAAGEPGVATRHIYRALHLEPDVARQRLDELARQGVVEPFTVYNARNRAVEMWRRADAA